MKNRSMLTGNRSLTMGEMSLGRYLVDLRDDKDPPFTFRAAVLGTVIGGLGAALNQVRHVQPYSKCSIDEHVQTLAVDLYFQASSNRNLDDVFTRDLLIGDFMVNVSSKEFSGRRNTIRMAWSNATFCQPWKIQTQGGAYFVFTPMSISPSFRP